MIKHILRTKHKKERTVEVKVLIVDWEQIKLFNRRNLVQHIHQNQIKSKDLV